MALIRRRRFILTESISRPADYGVALSSRWMQATVLQDVPDAVCWRCKTDYRRGDHLVHLAINSYDHVKANAIYHYRCIPPTRWRKVAGSLPAWELPSDESPAENAGTSSAAGPTP
jgi:hypothetical protein